jgi:large subunit ribosomal protein L7/L12
MTMRDDTLVTPEVMGETLQQVSEEGSDKALEAFAQSEPILSSFLADYATKVAGKMALTGAGKATVRGVHQDLLMAGVLVYRVMRHAGYKLWEDTALGDRLRLLRQEVTGPTAPEDTADKPAEGKKVIDHDRLVVLIGPQVGRKTALVQALRRLAHLSTKQARRLIESTPAVIGQGLSEEQANQIKTHLEQSGGRVVVMRPGETETPE